MNWRNLLSVFALTTLSLTASAQNTVGLIEYLPWASMEGYNLFYPHNQPNVYLIDNCGEIVHMWEDSAQFRPGNIAYLLEDGKLVKAKRLSTSTGSDPMWAGGGGETVEIRDWDNTLLWSMTRNDSMNRLHHDIAPMPNGNILMINWERKTFAEAVAAGRDTSKITDGDLWPETIIEVQPIGTDSFDIVWEWKVWDHLIQDYDTGKANFGVVGNNPSLIDLNYDTHDGDADWLHANALDYKPPPLDQVVISIPYFDEIWIIDHSTTTSEAAGHTGGLSGKGGDLIYRWGNPQTYRAGDSTDQRLFFSHDIHWVDRHLDSSDPNFGKMIVFNNRVTDTSSAVGIFAPVFDDYSWSYQMTGGKYDPVDFDWTFTTADPSLMHSTGLSSVQRLANGNTLIDAGRHGNMMEVNPAGNIVWWYKTPLAGGNPASQGDTLNINQNLTFRVERFPTDYPAFMGRDLSPKGFLELNPDTNFCDNILSIQSPEVRRTGFEAHPNPFHSGLHISIDPVTHSNASHRVEVIDLLGQTVHFLETGDLEIEVETTGWKAGHYFVRVNDSAVLSVVMVR